MCKDMEKNGGLCNVNRRSNMRDFKGRERGRGREKERERERAIMTFKRLERRAEGLSQYSPNALWGNARLGRLRDLELKFGIHESTCDHAMARIGNHEWKQWYKSVPMNGSNGTSRRP